MEIYIGRDSDSSKLKLTSGYKSVVLDNHIVPMSVNENHCLLSIEGNVLRINNTDVNSFTYVNGRAVETKTISTKDRIELGTDHYPLSWNAVAPFLPTDIRQLQHVWEDYENRNISLQIAERKFNTLRSATGIITMAAIALSIATGGRSPWYLVLYATAIIVSLVFFIKAYIDSSKLPQKRQELTRQFQKDYVCPQCGHFLGNQSYDILRQNDHCPYCKTIFIH